MGPGKGGTDGMIRKAMQACAAAQRPAVAGRNPGTLWVGVRYGFLFLWVSLMLGGCGIGSSAPSHPARVTLGATRQVIDARWDVDPTSAVCTPENLELTCRYVYRGARIIVAYDQRHVAEYIQVGVAPARTFDEWGFLVGLVPSGWHRVSCRDIVHSSGGGKAHACIYRLRRDIIVARFYQPLAAAYGGVVTYDYAGYADIQRP